MSKPAPPSEVLDDSALKKAASVPVWSQDGTSIPFADLFSEQKTIVVIIRHFGCGAYVEELGKVPKASLDAAGTKIVVIGCGDWSNIKVYKETTNNFPYEVYAEPTRKLHQAFGLLSGYGPPAGAEKRDYAPSPFKTTLSSIWILLTRFRNPFAVGNFAQLGGEFVLGPSQSVTYAYRMKHSTDHVDVPQLMNVAGVPYNPDHGTHDKQTE